MGESGKIMFGHYFRNLDEKKRVMIPAKFRDELGEVFYITLGPDNVLEVRDEKSFNVWKDKLLGTNMLNANARKFARVLLGNTVEAQADKQGRVNLPETIITRANITKEVAFVGVGNKLEIWPKDKFEDFQADVSGEGSLDDLAKQLLKDGVEL